MLFKPTKYCWFRVWNYFSLFSTKADACIDSCYVWRRRGPRFRWHLNGIHVIRVRVSSRSDGSPWRKSRCWWWTSRVWQKIAMGLGSQVRLVEVRGFVITIDFVSDSAGRWLFTFIDRRVRKPVELVGSSGGSRVRGVSWRWGFGLSGGLGRSSKLGSLDRRGQRLRVSQFKVV